MNGNLTILWSSGYFFESPSSRVHRERRKHLFIFFVEQLRYFNFHTASLQNSNSNWAPKGGLGQAWHIYFSNKQWTTCSFQFVCCRLYWKEILGTSPSRIKTVLDNFCLQLSSQFATHFHRSQRRKWQGFAAFLDFWLSIFPSPAAILMPVSKNYV